MSSLVYDEDERIEDDYTLLEVARDMHAKLKALLPVKVYSKVTKVDHNFYITPNLEIAVPSVKVLFKRDIRGAQLIRNVLAGGIVHEDGHAYLFPFMTRMNITYAIVHGYVKSRNVEWDEKLFQAVENIVSDIFNELIMYYSKIPGWNNLPETRYHYVYKDMQHGGEEVSNPLSELLYVHSKVFSSIYLGKLREPVVPSPSTLGEHIYNILSNVAKHLDIESHAVSVNSGGLKSALAPLVFRYDMYDVVDKVYDTIEKATTGGSVDLLVLKKYLVDEAPSRGNAGVYWAYYTVLSALYRYAVEHPDVCKECNRYIFDLPLRPSAPSPDIMDKIIKAFHGTDILDPKLADYAARHLISTVLMVSRTEIETVMTTGVTKVPWYRRPRGKIDPRSLASDNILDWKVTVKTAVPESRRKAVQVKGVPDNITIIVDESGSTSAECTVISPIVGVETKVFDVERVTAMAMLYNVLRVRPDVPVNLVRFSDSPVVESGTAASIYDRLMNIRGSELQMGGTAIVSAVQKALELHRDGRTNYFILLTDMEIPYSDAEKIKKMVFRSLRLSPVLVVATNANAPKPLLELNKYENVAVVGVKTLNDYPLLEKAIYKLGKLIAT